MMHPQTRALLDLIEQANLPPTHTLAPEEARRMYRERRYFSQPAPPEVAQVRDLEIDGPHGPIRIRLVRPRGAPADARLPVLVYYHGGGWTIGDLDTHDTLCRELANGAGCAVVSVDYRMGPEHRFPAAVDDCIAATYWVARNADALGVDASRMAVGGDSAGGNLAAVVAIAARDAADLPIAMQLLIYPATDQRRISASYAEQRARLSADPGHDDLFPRPLHHRSRARPGLARLAAAARRPLRPAAGAGPHRRLRPAARRGAAVRAAPERGGQHPPRTCASSARSTASSRWAR